ncbi:Thermostable carboxypeptidase 1-like protein, partial [Daphnia magna]
ARRLRHAGPGRRHVRKRPHVLRGPQPRLRLQRRGAAAGRHAVRPPGREEAVDRSRRLTPEGTAMNIEPRIAAFHDEMTRWRRDIHAHPELGFEEERTSAIVAEKLREFGCEVATGLARTGVVGTIRVGNSPDSIGLRADMDCLPMQETNTFEHASKYKGKMHGCG